MLMYRNVFMYWVGKEYSLISILRRRVYAHSKNETEYKVHLITHANLHEYMENVPECFYSLCPAHQADVVRVHVICERGGIWLDSDTIVMGNLDSLFENIENKNGFFIKENNEVLWTGVFGSKPGTTLLIEWKHKIMDILRAKQNCIHWTEIGSCALAGLHMEGYHILNGLDTVYPVNWNNCVREYVHEPYENYKTIVREYQPIVVLVNSVYRELEHMTEDEILRGRMPLNYFLNKTC